MATNLLTDAARIDASAGLIGQGGTRAAAAGGRPQTSQAPADLGAGIPMMF
ncbi:hypothetical protein [Paraburkholderia sp. BCC1885]|uniref:hypothetical protein n=1 Tax=Paraburkholderia sp. BCC1885 TaxID=2562669 RepID=UPI001643529B|nr:hypothetical protein [Paraburkholderia sp. BCC1885]